MLIGLVEEQLDLRDTVRRLFGALASETETRRVMATEGGVEAATWKRLVEHGLTALAVPEELGGAGGSQVDLGVVVEEAGRRLLCAPLFSTAVLGVDLLRGLGEPDLLRAVAADGLRVTVSLPEADGDVVVRRAAGEWRLSGTRTRVLDGHTAAVLLVVAGSGVDTAVFEVSGEAVDRAGLPTMDQTRRLARVAFADTPARRLDDDPAAVDRTVWRARAQLAAEQLGGMRHLLESAVDHARSRTQFGRPVGSFQAVQHKLVDMLTDVEAAASTCYYALRRSEEDDLELASCAAAAFCSDAYRRVAGSALQVFGGIGMTWEHHAHLYLKRARSSGTLLGTPAAHRERIAELLGMT